MATSRRTPRPRKRTALALAAAALLATGLVATGNANFAAGFRLTLLWLSLALRPRPQRPLIRERRRAHRADGQEEPP